MRENIFKKIKLMMTGGAPIKNGNLHMFQSSSAEFLWHTLVFSNTKVLWRLGRFGVPSITETSRSMELWGISAETEAPSSRYLAIFQNWMLREAICAFQLSNNWVIYDILWPGMCTNLHADILRPPMCTKADILPGENTPEFGQSGRNPVDLTCFGLRISLGY